VQVQPVYADTVGSSVWDTGVASLGLRARRERIWDTVGAGIWDTGLIDVVQSSSRASTVGAGIWDTGLAGVVQSKSKASICGYSRSRFMGFRSSRCTVV
jgi:hypothetical protein